MEQNNNQVLALPYECWRWHPEFKGIAQVSTRGDVKTVDRWVTDKNGRKRFIKGRIMKPHRDKDGYLFVVLKRNGKQRDIRVHRMVLEVWGDGNPENKPEVNHIDEDKSNNEVYNLEWSSHKDNVNFGTRNKRIAASKSKPVEAIDPNTGMVVLEFSSTREAQRKGFHSGTISECCRGKLKTYKGLVWRYKD